MDSETESQSGLYSEADLEVASEMEQSIKQLIALEVKLQPFVLAYSCRNLYVVGGSGADQTAFRIYQSALDRCPVIKNPPVGRWVECPGTEDELPNPGKRRKDLYLEAYSSEVVKGVFSMLVYSHKNRPNSITNSINMQLNDATYFAKFYHLAASLKIQSACAYAVDYHFVETPNDFYLNLLGESETTELMESNARFRNWIWRWMAKNRKLILEPQCLADGRASLRALFQVTKCMHSKVLELRKEKDDKGKELEELQGRVSQLADFVNERAKPEE